MENMVNVYFFGKKYTVPADLTIMTAMEYAGYTLKRGCGCRHGFCGACVLPYRQETLQHRRPSAKPAGHDGALPGNLQLYRL